MLNWLYVYFVFAPFWTIRANIIEVVDSISACYHISDSKQKCDYVRFYTEACILHHHMILVDYVGISWSWIQLPIGFTSWACHRPLSIETGVPLRFKVTFNIVTRAGKAVCIDLYIQTGDCYICCPQLLCKKLLIKSLQPSGGSRTRILINLQPLLWFEKHQDWFLYQK